MWERRNRGLAGAALLGRGHHLVLQLLHDLQPLVGDAFAVEDQRRLLPVVVADALPVPGRLVLA